MGRREYLLSLSMCFLQLQPTDGITSVMLRPMCAGFPGVAYWELSSISRIGSFRRFVFVAMGLLG